MRSVKAAPRDIISQVDEVLVQGNPILVLFESGLDDVHNSFLTNFLSTRSPNDHLLLWRGEGVSSKEQFYDECVRVMPGSASYFGRNLDALDEVLQDQDHGLAPNAANQTYWIFRNVHLLFSHDPDFFRRLFAAMVQDARHVIGGIGLGGIGSERFPAQKVSLVLTGLWEVMGEVATQEDSFLHMTRWWQYRPQPPPEPTGLKTFRVTK